MSLEFLSPAASPAAPPARGPILEAAAADTAALVETRHGWQVIGSFGRAEAEAAAVVDSVAVADRSHLSKFELLTAGAASTRSGLADLVGDWWLCPVRPGVRLLVAGTEDPREAEIPSGSRTVDLTGALCAIAVVGPAARETIARFCALDLRDEATPVRGFRPGSVARTPGHVLREAPDRFLIISGAAYGIYLWQVVLDAAERLGGCAVGLDALPALESSLDA